MIRMAVKRMPVSTVLRRLALGYLITWVVAPPLAYGISWRIIAVVAMATWLGLELISPRSVLWRPNWVVLGSFVFAVYTLAIEWLVPDAADISRHFQVWIMLFFLLVGLSFDRGRDGDARFSFWIILCTLPIWSFATLRGLNTVSDDVARIGSRSSIEAQALADAGVGGFGFVYMMLLCLPFLAYLALHPSDWIPRIQGKWRKRLSLWLAWTGFLLGALLIINAGYSIALLLGAIAIAVLLVVRSRRSLPMAISLCVAALLVLAGALALGPTLRGLESATAGTEYETKIRDVRASLESGESLGTVSDRTERYARSFRLFIENPVIGTLKFDDIGKHSAILDRFAQYGLAIGVLFFLLLIHVPLSAVRDRRVPIGLGLGFAVVGVGFPMVNNVFMAWGLALYVFSRGVFVILGIPLERRQTAADGSVHLSDA